MSSDPPLISMQDHDLLIQLHTKLDNLTSKLVILDSFDSRIRDIEQKDQRHSEKISNLMTELSYVKQTTVQLTRINNLEEDIKEIKSNTAAELKGIKDKQITSDRINAIADDVDALKKMSNLADTLIAVGTVISGLIGYFK